MKLPGIIDILYSTPNRKKVASNVFWAVLGKIVGVLSGLFVGVFVARYLGPDQYGLMNYVISYVTIFSILANFGLDSIVIRELAKNKARKEVLLGTALKIRIVFASLTIVLIAITLILFESDSFTITMIMIYSLSLILGSFNVIRNYFTSIVLNKYIIITEIVKTLIVAGIKLYLVINHYPLSWFIAAITFEFILMAGGMVYAYQKKIDSIWKWQFNLKVAMMFVTESFPLVLSGAAIVIYQKIDQIMIRNMIDNAALGKFAVASKFTEFIVFLPILIVQIVMPLLVKVREKNMTEYKQKRQQFLDIIAWGSFAIAAVVSLSANFVITLLYGVEYTEAIHVLQIMAWKAIFAGMFISSGQIIIIENLQKYAVTRNLFGCVVSILLNLLLIPHYGITGAAVATIITMAFSGYLSHIFIPPYRYMFRLQTRAILTGWKRIFYWILNKT